MTIKKGDSVKKVQEAEEIETPEVENVEDVEIEDLNETPASDTLRANGAPVGPANKPFDMAKIINALAHADKETVNKFAASMDWVKGAADGVPDGSAGKNKDTIKAKPSAAVTEDFSIDEDVKKVISEEISSLFEGENLKPEFKEKISTVVESVINLKSAQRISELEEEYEEALALELKDIEEAIVNGLDEALNATVDTWLNENEVAITSQIRVDLSEQFVEGLRDLFDTHYINVPEDKIDVVEEMEQHIAELEETLNAALNEKINLQKEIEDRDEKLEEAAIMSEINKLTEGMVETDKERFLSLVENVEFTDLDEFVKKANTLKETVSHKEVSPKKETTVTLFEEVEILEDNTEKYTLNPSMKKYLAALDNDIKSTKIM